MNSQPASDDWRIQTELRQAEARTTSRKLVLAEVTRLGVGLSPEVIEILADRWSPLFDNARSAVIADHVSRHLADADVVRLSRPTEPRLGTASGVEPTTRSEEPFRFPPLDALRTTGPDGFRRSTR